MAVDTRPELGRGAVARLSIGVPTARRPAPARSAREQFQGGPGLTQGHQRTCQGDVAQVEPNGQEPGAGPSAAARRPR